MRFGTHFIHSSFLVFQTVKGARNLQPKDTKSLPDVACHLAIFPSVEQVDASLYSQNIMEWKESGIIGAVKTTSFAPATLVPAWNQTFKLYVTRIPDGCCYYKDDVLCFLSER